MNILIHGIHNETTEKTIGKIAKYLNDVAHFNYGWHSFISVAWKNKQEAKKLARALIENECANVWGHSNGCAIAVEAARQGGIIKNLVLINPALKINTAFPANIGNIIVIHTKHDKATKAARIFNSIPFVGLFVINAWGAMGTRGYKGDDDRVINLDFSDKLDGHSSFFKQDITKELMPIVKKHLIE